MKIDGVTAIVTGDASGLGAATARKLAEHGTKVGIFDLNEEAGLVLARELDGAYARANVADETDVDAAFDSVRSKLGQERILVNCAGTTTTVKTASRDRTSGEISHFPLDAFDRIIQINLIGTFRCISKSAAGMMTLDPVDGERGAIVNTASAAAEDGQIGQAAYSASKSGIVV